MASTSDIKNGMCLEFNGNLVSIVSFQHVKPGKGPAFVRTKLKNIATGKIVENTFSGGAKFNEVRIERRPYQYLYKDDLGYIFMHTQNFEQVTISENLIDHPEVMKESVEVEIVFHAEEELPLNVDLPPFVVLEVTYTEPGLKGDTSSSTAMKQATLETGCIIKVPLFINIGDKIKVDTRDISYSERVKE